jgi:hypothetical protein
MYKLWLQDLMRKQTFGYSKEERMKRFMKNLKVNAYGEDRQAAVL